MFVIILFAVGILATACSAVVVGKFSDDLIDYQFEHHHKEWQALGSPRGGKVTRDLPATERTGFVSGFVLQRWLVSPPPWLHEAELPRLLMFRIRLAVGALFISVLLAGGAMMLAFRA